MAKTASSPILQLIRRACHDPQAKDLPDPELLRHFLGERDEQALEALLRRHGPMVLDVCRGVLGNEADAEDAFQATWLILARKAGSIRRAASLASWLHGVAYRTALRARANAARRHKHEARAPQRRSTTDPDDLTWREVRHAVHEELARLPARHRAALVLCYLQGKTQDEAALQLGLPKGALKGHLERGRALLRARLLRRGLGPGAVLVAGAWPAATTACLSPALLVATVRAATAVAAGSAAASVVSSDVARLSEGMVRAMFLKKIKIAAILLLVIAGSGAGLALAGREPAPSEARVIVEQAAPEERPRPAADPAARPAADAGKPLRSLAGHKDRVKSVTYSPDGRWIATAGWDGTARLWDAQTGEEVRRLVVPPLRDYPSPYLTRVLFSPDNAFVITALQAAPDEAGVIIWDRRTGKKVHELLGGSGSMALSPDGKYIASGGMGVIRVYELATGKLVRAIPNRYAHLVSVTYSPDGKTLFAQVGIPRPPLKDGTGRLGFDPIDTRSWDVASGQERRTGRDPGGVWNGHLLVFSPDGRTLAVGTSLFETATGGERVRLIGHTQLECGVAFSPDGRTLASASMDGTVRLWDLPSGREVGRFGTLVERFKGGWVLDVAFSPDGQHVISGGLDKQAHIWDVSRIVGRPRATAERSPAELEADWKDLAGDAKAGYAALGRLMASPGRAVPFLGKQLQGLKPVDTERVERLIADLDDKRFRVREQATRDLEALAEHAVPFLRKALAGGPSLETSRRIGALLERLADKRLSAETVRMMRAVEALESIGNAEARRLLARLASGPAQSLLAQEARAAAGRLAR
jgi:RNA polymerase sigma factor (sigma-70 family)